MPLALRIATSRRWLTATRTGLVLTDSKGKRELDDEDVTDIGVASRWTTVKGERKAFERKCHLVLRDRGEPIVLDFVYTPDLSRADPLGDFLDRNTDRLTERAERVVMAEAGELAADGWVLNAEALTHGEGAARVVVKMSDLDAVDVVDGAVSVWVGASPRAVVRVPCGSVNAEILERLLRRRLEERPRREEPAGPGLGRVVFERDHSIPVDNLTGWLWMAGFFWVGISAAAIDAWGKPWNVLVPIGVPLVLGAAAGAVWLFRENVFRCHARGVTRTVWRRTRQILYEEVGTFSYKATRHLVNGAYTGTEIELKFLPWPRGPGDAVSYAAMVTQSDEELDKLRDLISTAIAEGMRQRLAAGIPVEWVPGARFTRKGLELRPDRHLRRRDKEVAPYDEIGELELRQGELYLHRRGGRRPELLFTTPVGSPNFFPGFYLLAALKEAAAKEETPDEERPSRPAPRPEHLDAEDEDVRFREGR